MHVHGSSDHFRRRSNPTSIFNLRPEQWRRLQLSMQPPAGPVDSFQPSASLKHDTHRAIHKSLLQLVGRDDVCQELSP